MPTPPHHFFQSSSINWLKQRFPPAPERRKGKGQQAITSRFGLLSGLAVAGVAVGLSTLGAWRVLELQSYNLLHRAQRAHVGAPTWNENIVVIAIDDRSAEQLGRFPSPQQTHADLLNRLASAKPAAVAFDTFFPNVTLPDAPDADQFLAESIVDSNNVVLAVGDSQGQYTDIAPTIAQSAEGFFLRGATETTTDEDGVSRQLLLHGEKGIPALGIATLQMYAQTMAETTQVVSSSPYSLSTRRLSTRRAVRSAFEDDNVWIHWPGEVGEVGQLGSNKSDSRPGELQVYSYVDVLNGQLDGSLFQDKIVLVGSTLTDEDTLRTPFQQATPTSDVYLHAAIIDNLLDQSFLRSLTGWQSNLLLIVLAVGGSHLLRRQDAYKRLAMVSGFPLLWGLFAYAGFAANWWLPVAAPIGTIVLSALVVQLHEQQEKQQLMALFSMNVSPETAELIWRHKGQVLNRGELAAQSLTATVLFMDIRGFTGIAETLPSQQLLPWLNQYFETMTDCIMENGGMVDKYIGDAIMAVFGAPVPRTCAEEIQADAIAAVQTAVEMHGRLTQLNCQLAAQGLPTISFGIGIHTGPLVAGTVGNRHRLNYSLFGDSVNIAARLESMTKIIADTAAFKVLISSSTQEQTKEHFALQPMQSTQLRGRQEYTDVYTLVDKTATTTHSRPDFSDLQTTNVTPIVRTPVAVASHISSLIPSPIHRDVS